MAQTNYPGFWSRVIARGLAYLALMLGASALAYLAAGTWPRPVSLLVVCAGSASAAFLLAVAVQRQREAEHSLAQRAVTLESVLNQLQGELEEHAQDRAALARANANLQGVLDAATQIAIIATDLRGTITLFSRGAEKMLGYKAEDVIGRLTPEIFHLATEVQARAEVLNRELGIKAQGFQVFAALIRLEQHETREWTMVRRDGQHIQVELSVTGKCDDQGDITGFLGVAVDITARKAAEANLLRSEARLAAVLNTAVDGIFTVDSRGVILSANLAAARIFGYNPGELEGRPITDIMPEPYRTRHPQFIANYLTLGVARIIGKGGREVPGVRKDGSALFLELAVSVIRNDEEILFTGILRDISQRKADREALESAHQKLARRQQEVDRDLAMAAAIQKTMLPQSDVCFPGLDSAWSYRPSQIVGGDWFSLFALDGDRVAACLVDVSGHGVAPALIATSLANALRSGGAIWESPDPGEPFATPEQVLARLENDYPLERFNMFFTIICLVLHLPSGRLLYANAGHPPPLLLRADGAMERLEAGGPMIGIGLPQEGAQISLNEGDALLLFTDGCIEHHDEQGVQFGMEGMEKALAASGGSGAQAVVTRLEEALQAHGAEWEPEDDLTLICLRYQPETYC